MKKDRPRRPWLGRSRRGDLQNNEFDLTIRPVMVRALIVAHEPRQARIAGQLNVLQTRFARTSHRVIRARHPWRGPCFDLAQMDSYFIKPRELYQ